jgi:prevent-host-death family protein
MGFRLSTATVRLRWQLSKPENMPGLDLPAHCCYRRHLRPENKRKRRWRGKTDLDDRSIRRFSKEWMMITVASTELKNQLGRVIEQAKREPVLVQSYGRDSVVILDCAEYARLRQIEAVLQEKTSRTQQGAAFLLSLAGLFDSGLDDTSERAETLVKEFILQRHQ